LIIYVNIMMQNSIMLRKRPQSIE